MSRSYVNDAKINVNVDLAGSLKLAINKLDDVCHQNAYSCASSGVCSNSRDRCSVPAITQGLGVAIQQKLCQLGSTATTAEMRGRLGEFCGRICRQKSLGYGKVGSH